MVRAFAWRYAYVGKREKGQLLDQLCEPTEYTRKYVSRCSGTHPS